MHVGLRSVVWSLVALLVSAAAIPAAAAVLNAHDFPTPQAAIDAAHDGDRIYLPAGTYMIPDSGLVVDKPLELFGDGIGRGESGTLLKPRAAGGNGNVIVIRSRGGAAPGYVTLRDLRIGPNGMPGTPGKGRGYGILLQQGAASRGTVQRLIVERIVISAMAADGIRIEGGDMGSNAVILSTLSDVQCIECRGAGLVLRNGAVISVVRGYFNGNHRAGIDAEAVSSLRLDQVAFQNDQNRPRVEDADLDAQLRLKLCHAFNVLGCYFEEFASPSPGTRRTAVVLENCRGGVLQGCYFTQPMYVPGSRGVLATAGSSSITFGSNSYDQVAATLELEDNEAAHSHVVFPQCAIRPVPSDSTAYALRVGGRAARDVLLLPPGTAADPSPHYFDGIRWRKLGSGR